MKDDNDNKTDDLFPVEVGIFGLMCQQINLAQTKDGTRIDFKLVGMTTARFASDLSNDDYLVAVGEMLVRLCSESIVFAKQMVHTIADKYTVEQIVNMMPGVIRPVVKGGSIRMTYSTMLDFGLSCVIVEKQTLIKLITQWIIMLSAGDLLIAESAINTGYLRLVNKDDGVVVKFARSA